MVCYVRMLVCSYVCMHVRMHACTNVRMYICMHVSMYVCACVCIYIYIRVCVCVRSSSFMYICMYARTYVCVCKKVFVCLRGACAYIYVYVYLMPMSVLMYMCVHVCMCVCVRTHVHAWMDWMNGSVHTSTCVHIDTQTYTFFLGASSGFRMSMHICTCIPDMSPRILHTTGVPEPKLSQDPVSGSPFRLHGVFREG